MLLTIAELKEVIIKQIINFFIQNKIKTNDHN